ncbi:nicotinamide riboside kinase [Grosmannia clavigera kw1407]|uniref:Nicotinamide riboside kinase n=1 Tax=Grosmannia clavigera (strain kw1407 / UAMH 11150) TaxID=655863 RepID=F0X808_GROCL|nr:nicotinamide riboside kinase [Grosmannia clavigera kw1407]EFX06595.1 nicotinamide riboside kinase [Grosmannia clavigera kw1407]
MAAVHRKAVVIGISGCSSSGKTTLARLLRDIFPKTFWPVFVELRRPFAADDSLSRIPIKVDGLADWDCPEAIALPEMVQALEHIRSHGVLPVSHILRVFCPVSPLLTNSPIVQPDLFSKEDQNSVGPCPVSDAKIAALKARVAARATVTATGPSLCILDGFLLYNDAMRPAMDLLDVRLFLRVSHDRATQRRQARDGYVTLEGFWQDPPGYMDKIVWPNYVEMHRWMFPGGDVEAEPDHALLQANSILTQLDKGVDVDMETTLEWAVDILMRELQNV